MQVGFAKLFLEILKTNQKENTDTMREALAVICVVLEMSNDTWVISFPLGSCNLSANCNATLLLPQDALNASFFPWTLVVSSMQLTRASSQQDCVTSLGMQAAPDESSAKLLQHICATLSGVLAVIAFVQMARVCLAKQQWIFVAAVHCAIGVAGTLMLCAYALFPHHRTANLFLNAGVTSIELWCYVSMVYVWTTPSALPRSTVVARLRCGLWVLLAITIVINCLLPIMNVVASTSAVANTRIKKAGLYVMVVFATLVCLALGVRGWCLFKQLRVLAQARNTRHPHRQHQQIAFSTRILAGSVCLSLSVLLQIALWAHSTTPGKFEEMLFTQTGYIGFGLGIPVFITFAAMIFLLAPAVGEASLKSEKHVASIVWLVEDVVMDTPDLETLSLITD